MRILVACEESQVLTKSFRDIGHDAFSCDVLATSGDNPEWHLQGDVSPILNDGWDMIVAFPPCTYLSVTGNAWFNVEKWGEKAVQRHIARDRAVDFFMSIANADSSMIAIENPVGVMSTRWRKPDQIIFPYQFGNPVSKRTCLWLKGLPELVPTDIVDEEPRRVYANGKSMGEWYAKSWDLPRSQRAAYRSKTFPGIAKAMAEQWSEFSKGVSNGCKRFNRACWANIDSSGV